MRESCNMAGVLLADFNELLRKHETFYKALAEIRGVCDRALAEYGERKPEFRGGHRLYQESLLRDLGGDMPEKDGLVAGASVGVNVAGRDGGGDLGEPCVKCNRAAGG